MDSASPTGVSRVFGKHLSYCKYGFTFKVPQLIKELDEDNGHYIYVHRQHEDRMVVPYNPEIALLWGAKSVLEDAQLTLIYRLEECDMAINTTDELLALYCTLLAFVVSLLPPGMHYSRATSSKVLIHHYQN